MGEERRKIIRTHEDLEVYQLSFQGAMQIFKVSQRFPIEERYSLTDQIRRSSRSVCANLAEAWRKRRYEAAFIAKLNDSEAEASETQVWIKFAVQCGYLNTQTGQELYTTYDKILDSLVNMINHPKSWLIKP
ncbi:30S ribosomal protein S23 [Planktothrix tepida]|uniref:30S ribosomal protein S23 n=2 Tax=Planktothrix TaxID=54304 RepID=A0A9W4CTQ9_9CYAN|nr:MULTISPECIES: four helix bundle protein [Planktothrix]CAD5940247.1 30S ribosomal protein S23 [Planktothrix tepida]CAD5971234.1 30S ribosomal protein S23 [Planktothrix pseudagardhii]